MDASTPDQVDPPKGPIRAWCFTTFNYTPDTEEHVVRIRERPDCVRLVVGRELCPKTGTPHLQGYVRFQRAHRFPSVKKILPEGSHIEPRKAMKECDASQYCIKDGNVLVDHGVDHDATHKYVSRRDEAEAVIAEIESGESYGNIRKRHKQFIFWHRKNVLDYMREHEAIKSGDSEMQ